MKLLMNDALFEYDVRGLLMAFCPGQKFVTDENETDTQCLTVKYENVQEGEISCTLSLCDNAFFGERSVLLSMADRGHAKTEMKRALYDLLSEATGKKLPWGTLTGIRPTKITMAKLYEGETDEAILHHMKDTLYCSEGKAALSLQIAKKEKMLLDRVADGEGYSLYIGIPFCPTTCLYCSFTSYALSAYKKKVPDYLAALKKEIDYTAEAFAGKELHTIYFGGGTPTTLSAEQLDELIGYLMEKLDVSHCLEWTVEAGRPDSVTPEKLDVLRKYPVTRISINPQTMHQKTLDLIGRRHTVDDVRKAYALAREKGFDDINMDLIIGLPGETKDDVEETMKEIAALHPDNVTIHSLAIKRAARLNIMKEVYRDYRMENSDETMEMCADYLKEIGLSPYYLYRQKNMAGNQENTGYARDGAEGLYNILIMEEKETIVALGAGATTKRVQGDLITRAENVKNVDTYIANIDEMIERKRRLFSV